jgi:hypothetical protein
VKVKRFRTRAEILDLEDKYFPGSLGNLLSLGASHLRPSSRKKLASVKAGGKAVKSPRRKTVAR